MSGKMIISFFLVFLFYLTQSCPTDVAVGSLNKHLGCSNIYEGDSKCPTEYDCSKDVMRNKDTACTYKKETAEVGFPLSIPSDSKCISTCTCVKDEITGLGVFSCQYQNCFEKEVVKESCTELFHENNCCDVNIHCYGGPELPTCRVDGRVLGEGERMIPSEAPCKRCICKKDLDGHFIESFCEDIPCEDLLINGEKLRKNCVPVYSASFPCCPINYICPSSETKEIIPYYGQKTKTTEAERKFENNELQQYEKLKIN